MWDYLSRPANGWPILKGQTKRWSFSQPKLGGGNSLQSQGRRSHLSPPESVEMLLRMTWVSQKLKRHQATLPSQLPSSHM